MCDCAEHLPGRQCGVGPVGSRADTYARKAERANTFKAIVLLQWRHVHGAARSVFTARFLGEAPFSNREQHRGRNRLTGARVVRPKRGNSGM